MPQLILIALSEQGETETLANQVAKLDESAVVIVTEDIPDETADAIISMVGDLAKQTNQG